MDATTLQALENLLQRTTKNDTVLIFSGVNPDPMQTMQRAGFIDKVGSENVFDNIDDALQRATEVVERTGDPGI